MAKLETLTDSFLGSTLNTVLWTQFTSADGTTFTYTAGTSARVNFPTSTTATTDGDLSSVTTYDLTNSYVRFQVLSVPTSASVADAELRLGTSANYIRWVYEGGTLFAQYDVAGSKTTAFSVTYSATTHAFWRIREGTGDGAGGTAGTVYWDTSTNGTNWTNQASVADPIVITALTVLIAGLGTGVASSPGTFSWNGFNTSNPAGYTPVRVPNNRVGPMAMRHTFRQPQLLQSQSAPIAAPMGYAGGLFGGPYFGQVYFGDAAGIPPVIARIAQIAAALTATGGTQVVAVVQDASVAQVRAALTATGGVQAVASVQKVAIAQAHATLTATGGTQVVASVRIVAIIQVAATLTVTGGTQVVVGRTASAIVQLAATLFVTGGVQRALAPPVFVRPVIIVTSGDKTLTDQSGAKITNVQSGVTIEDVTTGTKTDNIQTGGDEILITSGATKANL